MGMVKYPGGERTGRLGNGWKIELRGGWGKPNHLAISCNLYEFSCSLPFIEHCDDHFVSIGGRSSGDQCRSLGGVSGHPSEVHLADLLRPDRGDGIVWNGSGEKATSGVHRERHDCVVHDCLLLPGSRHQRRDGQ